MLGLVLVSTRGLVFKLTLNPLVIIALDRRKIRKPQQQKSSEWGPDAPVGVGVNSAITVAMGLGLTVPAICQSIGELELIPAGEDGVGVNSALRWGCG